MERKTTEKKSSDIVPVTRGPYIMPLRARSWLENDFDTIFDDFRRSIDSMMQPYIPLETRLEELGMKPVRPALLDVMDEGDHFLVRAELPGFTKEDVDVQVGTDNIRISAKRDVEKEDKQKNYIHRERAFSSYERTYWFPEDVDPSKAAGTMKDGVLELTVTKKSPKPESKPRKVELK